MPPETTLPTDYNAFWSQKEVISISLNFSTASLYALSHYGKIDDQRWGDVYFPADLSLTIGGVTSVAYEVGVRMKGNTSRVEFLNQDGSFIPGGLCPLQGVLQSHLRRSAL